MSYRLTKIYTRTGDFGTTGLADGSRLPKHHLRIAAMGDVDELNCQLGMLLTRPELSSDVPAVLTRIQHQLFDLGAELSMPDAQLIGPDAAEYLEELIDQWNARLPPLEEFILPQGDVAACMCHVTRAVCRRAERTMTALAGETEINPWSLAFLNRLSDVLFVLARVLARASGGEIYWQKPALSITNP